MNKKYIIPIALAKLILAFLILQLFFSSCESDDLYYEASIYSDGALLELPATFGHGDQIYASGDTIVFEIIVNDLTLKDAITQADVVLDNPTLECNFGFINAEGQRVHPDHIEFLSGELKELKYDEYVAEFGYSANNSRLLNQGGQAYPYFRAELVFKQPGDYTVFFVNIPNHTLPQTGGVDIAYNYVDGKAESQAYAVYYFENGGMQRHHFSDDVRNEILQWSEKEDAFIDFTISENIE